MNVLLLVGFLVVCFTAAGIFAPKTAALSYIFLFLLTGSLAAEYEYLLSIRDWVTVSLGAGIFIQALLYQSKDAFRYSWIDGLLTIYFAVTVFLPLATNISSLGDSRQLFEFFIPLKIWLVYRIFRAIVVRVSRQEGQSPLEVVDRLWTVFLMAGVLAGVVALLRYFPIEPVQGFIEETWPIISNAQHVRIGNWGRLWSTMSGTNGSGIYFAFCAVIATQRYLTGSGRRYLVLAGFFAACMLLSGSLSAIGAFGLGLVLLLRKFSFRGVAFAGVIVLFVIAILSTDPLGEVVARRMSGLFGAGNRVGIMPLNLVARLGYWQDHIQITVREGALATGFGPGGLTQYQAPIEYPDLHRNPESFYSTLLLQSGLLSLLAYGIVNGVLFARLNSVLRGLRRWLPERATGYGRLARQTIIILLMYLATHIGNPTLYYGGSLELFAMSLATCYFLFATVRRLEATPVSVFRPVGGH